MNITREMNCPFNEINFNKRAIVHWRKYETHREKTIFVGMYGMSWIFCTVFICCAAITNSGRQHTDHHEYKDHGQGGKDLAADGE